MCGSLYTSSLGREWREMCFDDMIWYVCPTCPKCSVPTPSAWVRFNSNRFQDLRQTRIMTWTPFHSPLLLLFLFSSSLQAFSLPWPHLKETLLPAVANVFCTCLLVPSFLVSQLLPISQCILFFSCLLFYSPFFSSAHFCLSLWRAFSALIWESWGNLSPQCLQLILCLSPSPCSTIFSILLVALSLFHTILNSFLFVRPGF